MTAADPPSRTAASRIDQGPIVHRPLLSHPAIGMTLPITLAVVAVPLAHTVDVDRLSTVMLLVIAAATGWFLRRRK